MVILNRIKSLWRSLSFKESGLVKGSTFYGPSSAYMPDEIQYAQGTQKWKDSMYSFKLVVDKLEANKVYYYSFYIDPEGVEYNSKNVRYIATNVLLNDIRKLRLWTQIQ